MLTLMPPTAGVSPLPSALTILLAELRELPAGLGTPLSAGLLIADVLSALGWQADAIAATVGVDLVAVAATRPEVLA